MGNSFYHAQLRAAQRYNKELTYEDIKNIAKMIKEEDFIYLYPCFKHRYRHFCYVKYKNLPYKVLYRIKYGNIFIVTFYPIDVDEYNKLEHSDRITKNFINEVVRLIENE